MHILVTADTVGGVWTFTRELVTGLLRHGNRVTLVSFGDLPAAGQTRWMDNLDGLTYHPTAFKLEWMQGSAGNLRASANCLQSLIKEIKPDLLHFNQFYYGALECDLPRVVVAHSDVVSWWAAVHRQEPPPASWFGWYREMVARGLAGATAVVAPSRWMLGQVQRRYLQPKRTAVIYNGRTPALFDPDIRKQDHVVTVGRLWDSGKNAGLLLRTEMPAPIRIIGAAQDPERRGTSFGFTEGGGKVHLQPRQDETQLVETLARAAIYVAPSLYEPFGLAPVEAALSRCAVVASDIPSFRELWKDAAVFFRNNDAHDLRRILDLLISDTALRRQYANLAYDHAREKFDAARMVDDYLNLYWGLVPRAAAA